MNGLMIIITVVIMPIYYIIDAPFLVYYSIFSAAAYALNFFLINKYKMVESTWSTYANLTLYMIVCTICLGYTFGFQLYSMSTIPLIYQLKYLSRKFKSRDPKATPCSMLIVLACLLSSLYSVKFGPIYQTGEIASLVFLGLNTVIVCFFLLFFSNNTTNQIIDFELKLGKQANHDALTGLANRYNMISHLKDVTEALAQKKSDSQNEPGKLWVAMLDIDFFKIINDQYGHACGDEVLVRLSEILKEVCKDNAVSRWGGEEFLICGNNDPKQVLETLVKTVEQATIHSSRGDIHFTISIGVSYLDDEDTLDTWIVKADRNLYKAKESGKNQVVFSC